MTLIKSLLFTFFTCTVLSISAAEYQSVTKIYGKDTFEVLYGDTVVYLMADQLSKVSVHTNPQSWCVIIKWNGKLIERNQYINYLGKKQSVQLSTSDKNIMKFEPGSNFTSQGFFNAKTIGKVDIIVRFAGDTIIIPIEVIDIYIESIFGQELVEDFLGKPDKINKKYLPYGEQIVIDGISYDAKTYIKGIGIEHWLYNKYPGAVIQFAPIDKSYNVAVLQVGWYDLTQMIFDTY